MAKFLFFFYDIGIFLGDLYVYLFRFYSDKINKLYVGRQQIWADLEVFTVANEESIWIHCASLGEFEQGRTADRDGERKITPKKGSF